jgi:gliding motility-associated-like protein
LDNGLRYTVVDMNQNNGMGAVDLLQKNVFLTNFLTEKITVVRSEYIRGYWVIVHKRESNQFLAYKVDGCGVDPIPVISNVGTELLGANSNFDPRMPFYGSMKANNAGDRIAMPIDDSKLIDFYSFDAASGQLFNPITVEVTDNTPASPIRKYGCSFSPDGSMFYYTNNISVYQLKLTAYDSLSIATSHTLIATPANPTFQIEEGLDGKLYVAIGGSNVLDVINMPNSSFCDYTSNALSTNGLVLLGLPARVPERNFSSPPITMLPDSCWQSTTSFSINTGLSINQVSWNFGDPNSGGSNTSMSLNPSHLFSNVGTYTVSALVEFQCYTDTLELTLTLVDCPQDPPPVIPDSPLLIPNVISPNNDGVNDLFEIENLQENTELIILNRWGNVVFSSTNYQNNWDGKDTSGKELADGVYTYKYKTKDAKIGHGFLHLVR